MASRELEDNAYPKFWTDNKEYYGHRRSQYEANRGTRLGKILPNTVDFFFFIRLIILEDFIQLISYNGPCVRLGCSFFLATALMVFLKKAYIFFYHSMQIFLPFLWSSAHETCPANNYLYK